MSFLTISKHGATQRRMEKMSFSSNTRHIQILFFLSLINSYGICRVLDMFILFLYSVHKKISRLANQLFTMELFLYPLTTTPVPCLFSIFGISDWIMFGRRREKRVFLSFTNNGVHVASVRIAGYRK